MKVEKNEAIVLLRKLGWRFLKISKAWDNSDKRNVKKVWDRDKDKYNLPEDYEHFQREAGASNPTY